MAFNKGLIRLALTTIGVIGVPLTSWISIKCHERAQKAETKKEKVKCYIPAIISGAVTTGSIIGSHRNASKEIAAVTATATYAIANRNKLEAELGKYLTDDEVKKLKEEMAKDIKDQSNAPSIPSKPSIEWTGNGPLKVLEGYSGRLFYSSLEKVVEAERKLSDRFRDGDYICLNDFYRLLGIVETYFGHQWGWVPNEDYYPKFYEDNPLCFENTMVQDSDGSPLLVIDIQNYPMECWMEV